MTPPPTGKWRLGRNVPINVYDGDRPVCQCHSVLDAMDIVKAMNGEPPTGPEPDVTEVEKAARELIILWHSNSQRIDHEIKTLMLPILIALTRSVGQQAKSELEWARQELMSAQTKLLDSEAKLQPSPCGVKGHWMMDYVKTHPGRSDTDLRHECRSCLREREIAVNAAAGMREACAKIADTSEIVDSDIIAAMVRKTPLSPSNATFLSEQRREAEAAAYMKAAEECGRLGLPGMVVRFHNMAATSRLPRSGTKTSSLEHKKEN